MPRLLLVVLAGVIAATAATAGQASSLGGLGAGSIAAFRLAAQRPPLQALDSFTGPAGTSLQDHTADSGHPWTIHQSALALSGDGAVTARGSATAMATIRFTGGHQRVSSRLARGDDWACLLGGCRAGVVMHAETAGDPAVLGRVVHGTLGWQLQVAELSGGTVTVRTAVSVSPANGTLALTYSSGLYTVAFAGASASYTLPVERRPANEARRRVGVRVAEGSTRLDDLTAETLP